MTVIDTLAPQMAAYRKQFHTDGEVEWQPYVMFFHPRNYSSPVANTDSAGFRFSEFNGKSYSVANSSNLPSARLLAGNSVAFGIGATSDKATLPSRMMVHDKRTAPWLNFGGRAFNSAQELILISLYRHMLPKIDEIVLFSGANNLLLAKLPEQYIQEHGAFYNAGRFFDMVQDASDNDGGPIFSISSLFAKDKSPAPPPDNTRSLEERIQFAADLTLRHLDGWNAVAKDIGAKLTFILQPMSGWVREKACQEEEALFRELASLARYTTIRKDVLHHEVCQQYAFLLEAGARRKGIAFVNISSALRASLKSDQWLFIDHTHLTDDGYDLVAKLIIESTR